MNWVLYLLLLTLNQDFWLVIILEFAKSHLHKKQIICVPSKLLKMGIYLFLITLKWMIDQEEK